MIFIKPGVLFVVVRSTVFKVMSNVGILIRLFSLEEFI